MPAAWKHSWSCLAFCLLVPKTALCGAHTLCCLQGLAVGFVLLRFESLVEEGKL